MFSFIPSQKRLPIARVIGGDRDGVWLYIENEDPAGDTHCSLVCECNKQFPTAAKFISHKTGGNCSFRKRTASLVKRGLIPSESFDDFTLGEDEQFVVVPHEIEDAEGNPKYNQRIFISGPPGCGKSYWAGQWLKEYQFRYPEKEVAAFCHTPLDDDPAYRGVVGIQHDMMEPELATFAENSILLGGDLHGKICLFDDIDKLDEPARSATRKLLSQSIMMGRKYATPVCFCNHLSCDRNETRDILNGASSVVVFPFGGNKGQLSSFLERHGGFSKMGARSVTDTKNRWTLIHRAFPNYILSSKRISTQAALEEKQAEKERLTRRRINEEARRIVDEEMSSAKPKAG